MSNTDTIQPPRNDAIAPAGGLRMPATVLDMTDVSLADALDKHFGFDGAVNLATTGLHAPLTTTEPTKAETTQ